MSRITYNISGGLSSEQLDQMHAAALRVIDETGVEVKNTKILAAVAGQNGIRIKGTRISIAPELVNGCVAAQRRRAIAAKAVPGEFIIDILSGYAFQVIDRASGQPRPMTTEDCVELAKLVDGLHGEGVMGGTPGMPQDVPPELCEVLSYKIGCEYSRTAADVGITSFRAAETIHEMSRVLEKPFSLPIFLLDPLEVAGDSIDMVMSFIERDMPIGLGVSSMPLLGLTCPIYLPGAFVEDIASVLAASTLFHVMGHGDALRYHFDVYPFDLRLGTVAYGTPEHVLIYLLGAQINRYYGAAVDTCKPFHTNAIFPDAHSIAQRASFGMTAALDGARRFTFGGMLGIDKIFSAEQLIIDVEIMKHIRAVVGGFEFDGERLGVDAIQEVGPGGQFITHTSTLEHFGDGWSSDLFSNQSPEQWNANGRPMLQDRIHNRIDELLRAHDFELEPDKKRELDRIYARYRESVR